MARVGGGIALEVKNPERTVGVSISQIAPKNAVDQAQLRYAHGRAGAVVAVGQFVEQPCQGHAWNSLGLMVSKSLNGNGRIPGGDKIMETETETTAMPPARSGCAPEGRDSHTQPISTNN